jgi:hypothetical protein
MMIESIYLKKEDISLTMEYERIIIFKIIYIQNQLIFVNMIL